LEINNDKDVSGYSIEYDCDDNALQEYGLPVHKSWSKAFSLLNDMVSFMAEIKKGDDIVPLIIDIAPLDFERMIRNIIENARTHGFTDPKRDDYFIGIDLTVNAERDMFQIDFSNNGMPLPKGMDKNRYGLLGEKAGITGGSGRGGYVVKSIVEHYHGDYDIFMDGEKTVVRILLPISKQYGE
jgi:signal transduction histidine kinase